MITTILLLIKFWWQILIVVVLGIGLYLAVGNLRDLLRALRGPKK